jgi:hypothetical protein
MIDFAPIRLLSAVRILTETTVRMLNQGYANF